MKKNKLNGKIKVFSGNYSSHLHKWLNGEQVFKIKDADVVMLPGGGDWNPGWYGEKPCRNVSHWNDYVDKEHMQLILEAMQQDKLIVGICRGLQGIHIAAGGKLIQHVTNHHTRHDIFDVHTSTIYQTNSIHHQMVDLSTIDNDDYMLIAHTNHRISTTFLGQYDLEKLHSVTKLPLLTDPNFKEPEVVYYKKLHAVGFQYHPEMGLSDDPFVKYSRELVETIIENKSILHDWLDKADAIAFVKELIEQGPINLGIRKNKTTDIFQLPAETMSRSNHDDCCDITNNTNEENWYSSVKEL